MQVFLNVYDVSTAPTDESTEKGNDTIVKLNNVTRQLGIGGVFHGGVEVNGYEWSFGFCERGTGVYRCQPKKNPMYVYRETIDLGITIKTRQEVSTGCSTSEVMSEKRLALLFRSMLC
jgi:deubiquitinase DESI2